MSSELKVDTISEKTSSGGVTIDGVKLKDNAVETNTISEGTSGSGVTIDSVLVKDGVAHSGLVKLTSATASNSSDLTFDDFVDQSTYCEYIIVFQNIKAATDSVEFRVKFRVGGASGSDGSDTYRQAGVYYYANIATSALFHNNSITDYQTLENNVGNSDNEAIVGKASLFPATGTASASSPTVLVSTTNKENFEDNLRTIQRSTFAYLTTTGIKFYMSSGNITSGSIIIYGVKK